MEPLRRAMLKCASPLTWVNLLSSSTLPSGCTARLTPPPSVVAAKPVFRLPGVCARTVSSACSPAASPMMSDKRDNQRVNAGEREVVADERRAAGMVFVGRELGCMEAKTAGRNRAFPFMCKPTGKTDILSPKMFSPRLFPSADLHHGSFFHRANEPTSRTRRGHPFVPGLERGQPGGVGPAHAARLRRDAPARARLPAA